MNTEAQSRLLDELEKVGFPVLSTFWEWDGGADMWYLHIVSPLVRRKSIRSLYQTVIQTLIDKEIDLKSSQLKLTAPQRYKQEGCSDSEEFWEVLEELSGSYDGPRDLSENLDKYL